MLQTPVFAQDVSELVGRWPYGPTEAVAISGSYEYSGSGLTLLVADISDLPALQIVGRVVLSDRIFGVTVSGGFVYAANRDVGVRVIDVSMPSVPVEVGFLDTISYAYSVVKSSGFAYVAHQPGGLRVIDASTPSSPVDVGNYDTPGSAYDVAVSGGHVFLADTWSGLVVFLRPAIFFSTVSSRPTQRCGLPMAAERLDSHKVIIQCIRFEQLLN